MLSKAIYDQVFIEGYKDCTKPEIIEQCQKEFLKHGIRNNDCDVQKDVDFKIPPLCGKNIEEHFQIIGEEQLRPYRELVFGLLENIPAPPKTWLMQPGWVRYAPGCEPQEVSYPLEEALVFDVEVCIIAGKAPTLATAVSNKAWYSWISQVLIEGTSKPVTSHQYSINTLIPLESTLEDNGLSLNEHQLKPKVIVGHNVSFDRARIKEQYWLNCTGTRFVDTMSLHVCVGGLTSYQRAILKSEKFNEDDESWKNCSSLNNLVDIYKLYCGKSIKKESRDLFVKGTLLDIKNNFQEVMNYCSGDVIATYEVLKELFPMFLERFPHPVTLADIAECEQAYEDLESEGKILLARRADQACQLLHEKKYKEDVWMWDEDWTVKDIKLRKTGWGFLVPFSDDICVERKLPLKQLLEKCPLLLNKKGDNTLEALQNIAKAVQEDLGKKEYYAKLKQDKTSGTYQGTDGPTHNVGNPLAKDFLNKFSENVLAGDTESAEMVLTIARKLSYWRNNRDRIMDQMAVWLNENSLPRAFAEQGKGHLYGAIIPQIVVCGTLTRRAVEPTWMTASNAHKERIGSELRAMVQAPPGYSIIGADVDSQELWIASVLGDAHHAKMHGATPFGWMTLSGHKSAGTDMHSVTAKAIGISRDHAKVINYSRIYGAGQNFAERLLKQFNPNFADQPYTKWQAFELAKACGKTVAQMFHQSKWVGGTESAMFNRLEQIANSEVPRTPFLGGRLSRALEPTATSDDKSLPTRVNWVVQSGAADFLHLMVVCMRWILGNKVRFCLSFHDEVRYLVPDQYKYQAALALHVTNLLTRSFFEVDKVLRKDSKQDCVTPSNPHGLSKGYGIGNGEELDIYKAIEKAGGKYTSWYSSRFESK
ncbi:hypothetical protein NQ318_001487, partial [Aromia moschata]